MTNLNLTNENKKPVALVTGGSGFLGSTLCRALLSYGHKVYAVDNLITGRIKNLLPLMKNPNFYFFNLDVVDPIYPKIFSRIKIDKIYHLACPTGVPNIKIMGEEMLLTSSLGTKNSLDIALKHKAKIIESSSAEVYGDPEQTPQKEIYSGNVNPIGPRSAYEEGKRFSEALFRLYADKYGLDAKIARIFNTYGPNMNIEDQRVMPRFIKAAKRNIPFTIYGDGRQTRTFLYVDDLIRGLFTVMEKGKKGEAYNIGGEKQVSIKKLALIMKEVIGKEIEIIFEPHFIEDHNHRQPGTKKITDLGWEPKIALQDGFRRMIEANGF